MNPDGLGLKNDSLPFDFGLLEVDQEAERPIGSFQIVEALGYVFGSETVYAFQYDEECILDEKVGVVVAYGLAFVDYGEGASDVTWMPRRRSSRRRARW